MTPKLYLDEDFMPIVASALRAAGYDVVSVHEIGLKGAPDEQQLQEAVAQGRAILSSNHHDFRRIARDWAQAGREHFGVILSMKQYRRHDVGRATELISRFLDATDGDYLRNVTLVLDDFHVRDAP